MTGSCEYGYEPSVSALAERHTKDSAPSTHKLVQRQDEKHRTPSPVGMMFMTRSDTRGARTSQRGEKTLRTDRSILYLTLQNFTRSSLDRNDQGCFVAHRLMASISFVQGWRIIVNAVRFGTDQGFSWHR